MSERFWENVVEFFRILDLDSDRMLDRDEAKIGLTICFDAVHHLDSERNNSMNNNNNIQSINHDPIHQLNDQQFKTQSIQKQVDWLFAATSHDDGSPISCQQFRNCYEKLLQSAFEPEVLEIDLQRGLNALKSSIEHQEMHKLFETVNQSIKDICNKTNAKEAFENFFLKAFQILSEENAPPLSPTKHTQSARIIEPTRQLLLNQQKVSSTAIKSMYKKLLLNSVSAALLKSQLLCAKQELQI